MNRSIPAFLAATLTASMPAMADSPPITTRYSYDSQGQITSVQGKGTLRMQYDSAGNLTSISGPGVEPVTFSDFSKFGSPRRMRSGGRELYLTYTREGRLRWMSDRIADPARSTSYSYTPAGDLQAIRSGGLGLVGEYFYDDARRLIGLANSTNQQIRYTLDAAGNRTQTTYLDSDGKEVGRYREHFDELGRRISSQWGESGAMRYQYDAAGHLKSQVNALAQIQNFAVDPWGQRTLHTDASGVSSATRYDGQGNVIGVTDGRNNQTVYTRDHQGNALRVDSPDSGVQQQRFDSQGNLIQKIAPSGAITRFTYDTNGRLASKTYDGYPALDTRYASNYAVGWNAQRANVEERYSPPTIARTGEILTFFYQEPTGRQRVIDTAFAYDDFGRQKGISLIEADEDFVYEMTGDGQVTAINYRKGGLTFPIVSQIKHLPFGPVSELTLRSGSKVVRHYDTAYRLTGITFAGQRIASFGYDALGNVTSSQLDDIKRSFSYDRNSRLIAEQGAFKRTDYSYDAMGNRTQSRTTALDTGSVLAQQRLAFASDSNRLVARDGLATSTDAAGNLIDAKDGLQYVYDPENRLMELRDQNAKKLASYLYDERGRRIAVYEFDAGSGAFTKSTYYRHDPAGHLIALDEFYPSGPGKKVRWVWLNDLPIAQIDVNLPELSGQISVSYLHSDPLNTPRIATDELDILVWSWSGSAYGAEAPYEQIGGWAPAPTSIPLRFPGQFSDLTSPLFYNHHRDYNPELGRYMQSDPIGLAGGLNTFAYAGGNPASFFDILGLALSGQGTSRAGPGGFPQSALENRAGPRPPSLAEKAVKMATTAAAQKVAKTVLDAISPGGSNFVGARLMVGARLLLHSEPLGGCDASGNCSDMREPPYQCRP